MPRKYKFADQAVSIRQFEQAWSEDSMNFNGGSDNCVR
jgi:hypothetical protein